jgi:hypothetical protein
MKQTVEDIKATKKRVEAAIKSGMEEVEEKLTLLAANQMVPYFNGQSEAVKQECLKAKKRIKKREIINASLAEG